jgi:hypothetical protein
MTKQQSITSLPRSPGDDRRDRMVKYSITMGIRIVCVVLCFFVQGWWLLVCALGAVLLPYFAVVIANVSWSAPSVVARPGAIVKVEPPTDDRGRGDSGAERSDAGEDLP